MEIEKAPLQSKKFIAFLIVEATWKAALALILILGMAESDIGLVWGSIALVIVLVAGAIEALYIGGQAGLDKYTRLAQIAASQGRVFEARDIKITEQKGLSPRREHVPLGKRALDTSDARKPEK
jgi:hypothetical protein